MSNESDGAGKADNLEVIRNLLKKLEEAASDGSRPGDARSGAAQGTEQPAPRAKPPVIASTSAIEADATSESGPSRELSSLQRPPLVRVEPNAVPQLKPAAPTPAAEPMRPVPDARPRRSRGMAVASLALGALTAIGVVTLLDPMKWLTGKSDKPGTDRIEIASKEPPTPSAEPTRQIEPAAQSAAKPTEPPSPPTQKATAATETVAAAAPLAAAPSVAPTASAAMPAASAAPVTAQSEAAPAVTTPPAAIAPAKAEPQPAAPAQIAVTAASSTPAPATLYALSTPRRIEVIAGQKRALALQLVPAPKESDQLLLVLRGVPAWAALSKGSSLGNDIWLLPPHALDDIELEVADGANGSADLRVELATLDGRVLARAPMTLAALPPAAVSTAPPALSSLPSPKLDNEAVQRLLARGDLLLDTGELAAAREIYRTAAEAGSAGAALKLGETYDPSEVDRLGMARTTADEAAARRWYDLARALGSSLATDRLSVLDHRR